MSIHGGPKRPQNSKKSVGVVNNIVFADRNELRLHPSRTELPFYRTDAREWPFRTRVAKAKLVLHRRIHCFGHTPDPKWPFRTRAVKAHFFLNGKTEYFYSIFGPRDAQVVIPYESGEGEGHFAL